MENLNIAIVSCDAAYNKALMFSMLNACRSLNVKAYDSRCFVKEWSEYSGKGTFYNTFDIILWAGDEISTSYGDNIIYLTEKPSLIKKDYKDNKFCIYKYSSASTFVATIYDIYAHLTGRSDYVMHRNEVRLIAFGACNGGIGCTTIAMAVGQELCRFHNNRVLYLSLENIESTGEFMGIVPGKKNVSEFLYRLLSKTAKKLAGASEGIPFLDEYTLRNLFGIEAFCPVRGKNPLPELCCDDIQRFIVSLMESGRYDTILVDISTCMTEASIGVMSLAEKICFVAKSEDSKNREGNYLSQVISCIGEGTLKKIIKIENMCNTQDIGSKSLTETATESERQARSGLGNLEDIIVTKGYLSKFPKDRSGKNDISLEGAFGISISKLTAMLLEPTEEYSDRL